jgi:hypothetical protein
MHNPMNFPSQFSELFNIVPTENFILNTDLQLRIIKNPNTESLNIILPHVQCTLRERKTIVILISKKIAARKSTFCFAHPDSPNLIQFRNQPFIRIRICNNARNNVYLGWKVKYSRIAQPKRVVFDLYLPCTGKYYICCGCGMPLCCLFTRAHKIILCCVAGE